MDYGLSIKIMLGCQFLRVISKLQMVSKLRKEGDERRGHGSKTA